MAYDSLWHTHWLMVSSIMVSHITKAAEPGKSAVPDSGGPPASWSQLLAQASDPATSPIRLKQLANRGAPALDECLVRNPNTPPGVLKRLFLKNPLAMLANPILSYRAFTEAKLLHELLSPCLKLALYAELRRAGRGGELESLLPAADRVGWLRGEDDLALLDASQLPHIWECLSTDPIESVRYQLVNRVPTSGLVSFAADPSSRVREKLAGTIRSNCWVRQWRAAEGESALNLQLKHRLAQDDDESVRCALAKNPELGPAVHRVLTGDPSLKVRCELAAVQHPNIQPDVWRALALSANEVALAVAENPRCPELVRLELGDHPDTAVREKVWSRVNLQADEIQGQVLSAVESMLQDPDRERDAVALAGNQNIPDAVFNHLLHAVPAVTRTLAGSVEKAFERLARLVFHPDETTGVLALKKMDTCPKPLAKKLWATGKKAFRLALAGMPGPGPASLRRQMATDPDLELRLETLNYLRVHVQTYVAPGILECLRLMAHDPEVRIRTSVAQDARIDTETIAALSRDPEWEVRQQILSCHSSRVTSDLDLLSAPHATTRLNAAATLLSQDWRGDPAVSRQASQKAAKDQDPGVRLLAAQSPYSTCAALEPLIEDTYDQIQQAVAERPMFRSWCKTARLNAGFPLHGHNPSRTAAASTNPALRAVAAGIAGAGHRLLRELSKDPSWFVRHTVVNHPRAEAAVLATLAEDPHPIVKTRALSRATKP